jgi:hypothetical protein
VCGNHFGKKCNVKFAAVFAENPKPNSKWMSIA